MFVWGRNNSHLIRQNHKKTYSLPQPLQFTASQCAAGYDYLLLKQNQTFSCYYQAAIIKLPPMNLIDFATSDNMIVVITTEGKALISEFNPEALSQGFNFSPIRLQGQNVKQVYMNYGQIFLTTQSDRVYFMKRNQWYDTKNYSDPEEIQELAGKDISKIAPAFHINYFLTSKGQLYTSSKADPTHASLAKSRLKFIDISAADYFIGIAENGRLYIWGKYMQESYDQPIQFGKISQKFSKVFLNSDNGFAITESGEGWVWGKNANGELGISDYEPRSKPFPLITLKNYRISSFVQGEGFTVCFAEELKAKKRAENLLILDSSHNQVQPQICNKRTNNLSISSIPSIQIREFNKPKSKSPIKNLGKTEALRENYFKTVQLEKNTPSKQANVSKSPLDRSASKSPVSKYKGPYIEHMKQKSLSNCRQRKELSRPVVSPSKQQKPNSQLKQLQQQNIKLKSMLKIKQQVISDITMKIKVLEDAIEEHQKSLTNRDHLMEEYQKREKEYLKHIDDLEKELESLITKSSLQISSKAVNMNSKVSLNEPLRQKTYYLSRIQEYEKILNNERTVYQQKIRELEEAIQTYRSNQNQVYTLQDSPLCERSNKDNMVGSRVNFRSRMVEDNKAKMQLIISRIEDSKVRIGKSATKLNQFLVHE